MMEGLWQSMIAATRPSFATRPTLDAENGQLTSQRFTKTFLLFFGGTGSSVMSFGNQQLGRR
jgi:hypothetical protein